MRGGRLQLKRFKPETNRSCGVSCLRSILDLHNLSSSEKEIFDYGVLFEGKLNPLIALGCFAIEKGLKVGYVGFNPVIFKDDKEANVGVLKQRLPTYFSYGRFLVERAIRFLELGGEVKFKIPDAKDIETYLNKNALVLIGLRPALLDGKAGYNKLHYVVAVGYDEDNFFILDPSFENIRKVKKLNLLAAMYSRMPEILVIYK